MPPPRLAPVWLPASIFLWLCPVPRFTLRDAARSVGADRESPFLLRGRV
ncbi:MAG: hypothetical protein AAFX80_21900 [Cyanobacteria bacterium J06639_18]